MAEPHQPVAISGRRPGVVHLTVLGQAAGTVAEGAQDVALLRVRPHWIGLAGPLLLPAAVATGSVGLLELRLASPAVALLGLVVAAGWAVAVGAGWAAASLTLTTQEVILERGLLPRVRCVLPLESVHEVTCRQSLAGQALDFGLLELELLGQAATQAFGPAPSPRRLQAGILHCRRRVRGRHG
ncbi:MAG TPA: PH domain-containing protein [Candidatus Dormibacteraeota bacterium]|nr:PH domain-containing protein [Candidatus Dormibacteraeota bacterium]